MEADKPPEPEPESKPTSADVGASHDPPTTEETTSTDETVANETDSSPTSDVQLPKPTSNNPNLPTSKIEYRLPATFSAVPAILGQASSSSSPSANASASASPSASFLTEPKFAIIGFSVLLAALGAGGFVGYRYLHRQ